MKHAILAVCAAALLVGGIVGAYCGVQAASARREPWSPNALQAETTAERRPAEGRPEPSSPPSSAIDPPALAVAEPLAWSELLEPGVALVASAKSKALAGKRVRMVGFMAQMELPSAGAFYLVPRPIACDEAGGGTADLTPESVLVVSESAAGKDVVFLPGALDVSGTLEVGNQAGPDGRVSGFRLRLDRGQPRVRAALAAAANGSG
jgi:hypothetical protein